MNDLKAFYDGFSDALRHPDPTALPQGMEDRAAHRFAIYRNNVHRGLYDALGAAYPTVRKLVGEGFFDKLAQGFVQGEANRPGSLALYGDGFADFLDGHAVIDRLPYVGDIARLERARLEVSNARDAQPLMANALAGIEGQLEHMMLLAHPACRLVRSSHPIFAIWQAQNNAPDATGNKVSIVQRPEAVLIARPAMQVEMRFLSPGQAAFVAGLVEEGLCLAQACAKAIQADPNFDVTQSFAELLMAGAFDARFEITKGHGHDCT